MMKSIFIFFALFLASCGSSESDLALNESVPTGLTPTLARIDPASAQAGDPVTLFGCGFSAAPALNVISIGNAITTAETYQLLSPATADELEQITFIVPPDAQAGANTVTITVGENVSNANQTLTVNP
ncbi:MAG: hypothetical protein HY540_04770 [Deltaproteobacteria bacterium]|nr:hypothetical protein [Deltaproteobacteria bacterium]